MSEPAGRANHHDGADDDVPLRPAATVMLVRDAADGGIEVLMVRRAAAAAFAGGMYVFPGGRVDEADSDEGVVAFVDGVDDAMASAALDLPRGGLAYWVAAIRECFEETGLLLATATVAGMGDHRWAVHRGELSMAELCRRAGVRLDAGALRYVSHWVTPVGETSRRFDTRFFLAAAPAGQEGRHDDAELVDSRWLAPGDALAAAQRRELMLMPPTEANLRFIAGCSTVAEALARADAAGPPPRIEPRIRRGPDGRMVGIILPDDPDYDASP
jgi:8-oxo-dGTP pyrophosphatase MutT (NUDIX family)